MSSEEARKLIIGKRAELWRLYRVQEREWHQKSRTKWVVEGDKNTRYFHIIASARRRGNFMGKIGVGGNNYENPEEIKKGLLIISKASMSSKG